MLERNVKTSCIRFGYNLASFACELFTGSFQDFVCISGRNNYCL